MTTSSSIAGTDSGTWQTESIEMSLRGNRRFAIKLFSEMFPFTKSGIKNTFLIVTASYSSFV